MREIIRWGWVSDLVAARSPYEKFKATLYLLVIALTVCGCHDSGHRPICNGHPDLCSRPYNEVAYATTHNAFSHADGGWLAPNQSHSIPRQLADGVRALMIDVHPYDGLIPRLEGETYVCHLSCLFGAEPLVRTLGNVKDFLDEHPWEVVTLIFESYVPGGTVAEAFDESGLTVYAHAQKPGDPWPTLGEMIESGKRLVVLSSPDEESPDWYLDQGLFAWGNHWAAEQPEDLDCERLLGDPSTDLFILNHFLTNPIPAAFLAEKVNYNPLLLDHAVECKTVTGQRPNFITVDFYAIGDLFETVNVLNGLEVEAGSN